MTNVAITVATGTAFNTDNSNAVLSIVVTNTALIACEAGSNAYYYVTLSDGTNNENYTFSVAQTGSIPAEHEETFVVENTTLSSITESSGAIYYTAA